MRSWSGDLFKSEPIGGNHGYQDDMEDWKTSPGVIDETVRVAKKFLEEHPEEKRLVCHGRADQEIGSPAISEFLGWDKTRVAYSLERLGLIEEGIVEPEAVKSALKKMSAAEIKALYDDLAANGGDHKKRLLLQKLRASIKELVKDQVRAEFAHGSSQEDLGEA